MRVFLRLFPALLLAALPALAGSIWTIDGPDGGTVNRLVFDPADPSIVYAAATNGLFRSADGGRHWVAATPLLGLIVGDVAVAKSDPRTVYAASPSGLFKSSDGGASWRALNDSGSFHVAVSAQNPEVVYNVSFNGPVQSTDGGVTFASRGSGLPNGVPSAVAVDPQNAAVIYAAFPSQSGVFKSSDSGAHWAQTNSGLTAPVVFSLAIDPGDGKTLYAGGTAAVFKSTDGAASWTAHEAGPGGATVSALAVSPAAPATVLAATSRGVFLSNDGGASWSRAAGIADAAATGVAADPGDAATFLAALASHVYRTTHGGATSAVSDSGLASFATRSIAVDPHDDAVVYAAGPAGVARSADHGRTWSLSTALQPNMVAVDANASTLYALSGTVQRSLDGGSTWSPFGAGLPEGAAPFFLTADPRLSGTLYAVVNGEVYKKVGEDAWVRRNNGVGDSMDFVVVDPQSSSVVYAGGPTGIFKSSNGGGNWAPANVGLTGLNAFGLAVDPFDSQHLFAWSPTQVFLSNDGAASWTLLTSGPRGGRAFDPSAAGVVYASTFDDVLRSADGGATYLSVGGGMPENHSLLTVGAAGTLYIGSSGGGVFVHHFVHLRAVRR